MVTVAVDFDGVVHHYEGWDWNPPKGRPVEGIRDGLALLRVNGIEVVLFTARDPYHVQRWLEWHGLKPFFARITSTKPIEAVAFFDDRAWEVDRNAPHGLELAVKRFLKSGGAGLRLVKRYGIEANQTVLQTKEPGSP